MKIQLRSRWRARSSIEVARFLINMQICQMMNPANFTTVYPPSSCTWYSVIGPHTHAAVTWPMPAFWCSSVSSSLSLQQAVSLSQTWFRTVATRRLARSLSGRCWPASTHGAGTMIHDPCRYIQQTVAFLTLCNLLHHDVWIGLP